MTGVVLHIVSTRVPHMHLAIFSYKRVFGVDDQKAYILGNSYYF